MHATPRRKAIAKPRKKARFTVNCLSPRSVTGKQFVGGADRPPLGDPVQHAARVHASDPLEDEVAPRNVGHSSSEAEKLIKRGAGHAPPVPAEHKLVQIPSEVLFPHAMQRAH